MSFATPINPIITTVVATNGTTFYGPNLTTFNGTAVWLYVQNHSVHQVTLQFNGDANAELILEGSTAFEFPPGAVHITSVDIDNSSSGASTAVVDLIAGVVS